MSIGSSGGAGGASALLLFLAPLFAAHATCSVSMVLLNKTIAQGYDFPWTVLLIQNVGTVLLGYLYPAYERMCMNKNKDTVEDSKPLAQEEGKAGKQNGSGTSAAEEREFQLFLGMKVPQADKNKGWVVLQVVFFMATLFTSLKALKYISVPLYVV